MKTFSETRPHVWRTRCNVFELLGALQPFSADLKWYCLEIEPGLFLNESRQDAPDQRWIGEFCDEIDKKGAAFPLNWEELKTLTSKMLPEDMALFIATKPDSSPPAFPLNIASPKFEIAIQNDSCDSWYVTTRNKQVIAQLQHKFRDGFLVA